VIAAFIVAAFATTDGICDFFDFIGGTLMILAGADILLSWFGIDLAHKVGFGKFSYFVPYIIFAIGAFILSQTTPLRCG
jgi:hypothetical protein